MQALWMLLAATLFATMGVCVKLASDFYSNFEIVMYRGILGMLGLMWWCRMRGLGMDFFKTRFPMMHVWRSTVGVIALICWFYAIAHIPLATAMTMNYMSSVWIATFLVVGALITQRPDEPLKRQGPLVVTILLGFAGVALLLKPTLNDDQGFAALVGLISGVVAALAYLQVSALAKIGEPETRVVFYFSLGAALAGGAGTAVTGVSAFNWLGTMWLLPVGILALLGQICMTRAYASGATLLVANLQYTGIVVASLYSVWLFNDYLPPSSWGGMALIVVSGIAAAALRARSLPPTPPKVQES
ncbi:MAG: DMT family transporter [Burkholderiaceae bacterium]